MNRITERWDGDMFSPAFAKLPVMRRLLVILLAPLGGVLFFALWVLGMAAFILTGCNIKVIDKVMDFPTAWHRFIGGA